ncbi:MAG TPA: PGPGW domain-containing protein [Vicinamibacterales bacterium]|nr:PGPGW domain-containing protein [Vicinamibacterales bacterium]
MATTPLHQAKRLIKIVFALTLLVAGVAMLVLPGPGILAITFALAILSGEFVWARRLLEKIKASASRARDAVSQRGSRPDNHTP